MCGIESLKIVDSFSYESVCKSIQETENGKTFLHNEERFTLSQTVKLTYLKGNVCPGCGLVGKEYKKIEVDSVNVIKDIKHYLILVGNKNGRLVPFTKDHIIPFSFRGANRMINYQPMCEDCNSKKTNKMPDVEYEEIYRMMRVKDTIINYNRKFGTSEDTVKLFKEYHENYLNRMISYGYPFPLVKYDISEYVEYVMQSGISMNFDFRNMMERVPKES